MGTYITRSKFKKLQDNNESKQIFNNESKQIFNNESKQIFNNESKQIFNNESKQILNNNESKQILNNNIKKRKLNNYEILKKENVTKNKSNYTNDTNDTNVKKKKLNDYSDILKKYENKLNNVINFNTYLKSPNVINSTNFFMIIDFDDLEYYNHLFEYEKQIYMTLNSIDNINFSNEHLRDIYRILAFKIDTIHDFTDSRSDNKLHELIYKSIGWLEITKKLKKPTNIEDTFLYWLLRHNEYLKYSENVKIYITTSIENYIYSLKNIKDISYVLDASDTEKRISNFKNLLLFEKHFKKNNICEDIKKTENAQNIQNDNENNLINDIIDNVVKNSEFKMIYPQIFDANLSTGKTIKFIDKVINKKIEKTITSLSFDILDDKINMSIDENNKITVTIDTKYEYLITNIIILDKSEFNMININSNYLKKQLNKFKYDETKKILYCLETGPGVNNLVNIYHSIINYKKNKYNELINSTNKLKKNEELKILTKYIDELENNKIILLKNITVIKRIGDYAQIIYCKYNNKYTYISNDRMSSSFCYIENVNFIGQYKDCGIMLDFMNINMDTNNNNSNNNSNNNIDTDIYNKLNNVYNKLNIKFPNFISYEHVIDINNYINFLYNIYKVSFNFYDILYEIELRKYIEKNSIYSDKLEKSDYKSILLNLSFKIDSLHDFTGSRSKDIINLEDEYEEETESIEITKKELLECLEWDDIYYKIKKPKYMENNYFYWLLNKFNELNNIFSENEIPKVIFTTSIENYINCISKEKSFLTIDAIESRIRNFKNYLLFNNISDFKNLNEIENEIKNVSEYQNRLTINYNTIYSKYKDTKNDIEELMNTINEDDIKYNKTIDKIIEYFVYMFTYNEYLSPNSIRYLIIIILKYIIIKNKSKITLSSFIDNIKNLNVENDNINFKYCNTIDNYVNETYENTIIVKNNCEQIRKIFENQNICNDNKKYYICDILKYLKRNFEFVNLKRKTTDNSKEFFITKNILNKYDNFENYKKLIKDTYSFLYNEIIFYLNNFKVNDDIKSILIDKFVYNEGNVSLKIISPQLFDANSSTGTKITAKQLEIDANLDNTGYNCNINNFNTNEINLIKKSEKYKIVFSNFLHIREELKKLLYDSYKKQYKKENFENEYKKLLNNLIELKSIFQLQNKSLPDCSITILSNDPNSMYYYICIFANLLTNILKKNNIDLYDNNIQFFYEKLNILLSAFTYNDKQYCCYKIINNDVCINKFNFEYSPVSNILYEFDILKISINNDDYKINENYVINTIFIMYLKNKNSILLNKRYKSNENDGEILNKNYTNDILKCFNQFHFTNTGVNEGVIYIKEYMLNKNRKELYCLNSGPGVTDIVHIYNILKINKNETEKSNILENLLTIKRIGDFSQIEYCKKNNYIYISNDMMSASFSYIVGCKFIGSLRNFGIFIKNENEYNYCKSNDNKIIKCSLK